MRASARFVGVLLPVSLTVVSVTGCVGSDSGSGELEIQEEDIPQVTESRDLSLPLDGYMYTEQGYEDYLRAQLVLLHECLERFGVTREWSELGPAAVPNFDTRHEGRYGRLDLDSAAVRGYRTPPELLPPESSERDREPLSDEVRFLLNGRDGGQFSDRELPVDVNGDPLPSDGCQGEATSTLNGGLDAPASRLPGNLAGEADQRAETHPRVEEAMARWSECMSGKGYDYDTPREARNAGWPDPVSDEEITTAIADMECMIETNLVGIWHAVETAYQEIAIEKNAEALAAQEERLDEVYENSADVLARSGQP